MRPLLLALVVFTAAEAAAVGARVVIENADPPGEGFNDPTPAEPVGGNDGTTLGAQRLRVFERAAERWRYALEAHVEIVVRASFSSIPGCTASGGILGQARAEAWQANFPGAPRQNVWYPAALANQFARTDLAPGQADIFTQFNADLDNDTCLGPIRWYYGFDGNEGRDQPLFLIVLHEIGHGLGMVGRNAPEFVADRPTVFDTRVLDLTAGLTWDRMTLEQRTASMANTGNLVWDGERVRGAARNFLQPVTTLTVTEPPSLARNYDTGTAQFGPPANRTPMSGRLVPATDAADEDGPATTDGCSTYTNAAAVAGHIAFVDRGTCTFATKARQAQAAGAVGIVVGDTRRETCTPPGMAGMAPDVTIPAVSVSTIDAAILKEELARSGHVRVLLRVDPSHLAGTTPQGYMRLYAPCSPIPGSSVHHWDVLATPNLLMEPFMSSDLIDTLDLTPYLLYDIGWPQPPRSGRPFVRR